MLMTHMCVAVVDVASPGATQQPHLAPGDLSGPPPRAASKAKPKGKAGKAQQQQQPCQGGDVCAKDTAPIGKGHPGKNTKQRKSQRADADADNSSSEDDVGGSSGSEDDHMDSGSGSDVENQQPQAAGGQQHKGNRSSGGAAAAGVRGGNVRAASKAAAQKPQPKRTKRTGLA